MSDFDITIIPPPPIDLVLGAQQGHQGPPGPAGADLTAIAAAVLNGHKAVAYQADGRIVHASCDNLGHMLTVVGVITAAAGPDEQVAVKASDVIEFTGWAWVPGPVLLGIDGALTQTLPPGALFAQTVGRGAGTRLFVSLQPPILIQ